MGDVDLDTSFGTTWTLRNVRVVPELETSLISVGQLDDQGFDVKFGGGKWTVFKKRRVIARGFKKRSLYLVPVPSGEVTTPVKTNAKVGLAGSAVKRVKLTVKNSGTPGNRLERIRKSERVREFRDSGSSSTQSGNLHWVRKTRDPNEISPEKLPLVESVPLRSPESTLWESDGIEDVMLRSVKTVLGPSEAPTGPSV